MTDKLKQNIGPEKKQSIPNLLNGFSFLRNKKIIKRVTESLRQQLPKNTKKRILDRSHTKVETPITAIKQKPETEVKTIPIQEKKMFESEIKQNEVEFKQKYENETSDSFNQLNILKEEIEQMQATINSLKEQEKLEMETILEQKIKQYNKLELEIKDKLHILNEEVKEQNKIEENQTEKVSEREQNLLDSYKKLLERNELYKQTNGLEYKKAQAIFKNWVTEIWWDEFFYSEKFLRACDVLMELYKKLWNWPKQEKFSELKKHIENYKTAFPSEKSEKFIPIIWILEWENS